ncbi:MAG: DUF373 family protein [Candidatus Thermoplasmatota archaeon]|nr:DUF373 family protein [Candidatus Thermoplasmatota archaeon]
MKALVLCVDRDNDLGVKANVPGPVVGRQANLDAAMRLGIQDPEDTDVNTILSGVSLYDELRNDGMEVEVATIVGDTKVGPQSDRILSEQLDAVLEEVAPDVAYLVSDGAEDEYVYPMIASRIRVNHVKRVYVQQSRSVESAFYLFTKAIRDPRLRRIIVLPFALSFLALALVLLVAPEWALPAVLLVLGAYMLVRAYDEYLSPRSLWQRITGYYRSVKESLTSGRIALWFDIVAVMTFLAASFIGFRAAFVLAQDLVADRVTFVATMIVVFLQESFWIFIIAFLLHEGGKVAQAYFAKGKIARSFFYVVLSFVVLMLVTAAGLQLAAAILDQASQQNALIPIYIEVGLAISIVLVAAFLRRTEEREALREDAWRP